MAVFKDVVKNKPRPFIKTLPDWFSLKNYHKANQLSLEGWINQLYLRNMLQGFLLKEVITGIVDDYMLPEKSADNASQFVSAISLHGAILITEALKESVDIPIKNWESPAFFKDITTGNSLFSWCSAKYGDEYLNKTALASVQGYAILKKFTSIDLSAPDTVLIASFKNWLKEQRAETKEYNYRSFSKAILRRWAMNQILPYIDLIYWAELTQVQIPHWLMGEALFPGENQGDKVDRVRKTTEKVAKEVLQDTCIHAMAAQLKFETGKVLDLNYFFKQPYLETKTKIFLPPTN